MRLLVLSFTAVTNISIIVPVLNEAPGIATFLANLRKRAPDAEIIVADAGSRDGTADIAAKLCDQVVTVPANRGRQMNAGAGAAHHPILWFLHADAEIPPGAPAEIENALRDREIVGGFFRIRIPRESFVYRLTDGFAHYAGLLLRIRCGDHGFFCRREVFEQINGFPEVEVMEDADFYRRLRRAGKTIVIRQPIIVSARRYELVGPVRLTFAFGLIALLYFFRVPRSVSAGIYRRACCRW